MIYGHPQLTGYPQQIHLIAAYNPVCELKLRCLLLLLIFRVTSLLASQEICCDLDQCSRVPPRIRRRVGGTSVCAGRTLFIKPHTEALEAEHARKAAEDWITQTLRDVAELADVRWCLTRLSLNSKPISFTISATRHIALLLGEDSITNDQMELMTNWISKRISDEGVIIEGPHCIFQPSQNQLGSVRLTSYSKEVQAGRIRQLYFPFSWDSHWSIIHIDFQNNGWRHGIE
jgi:hypothetical protein